MAEKTKKKKCPFFDICGAYIIREKRGEKWSERFCSGNFKKCVHYQDRCQTEPSITKP